MGYLPDDILVESIFEVKDIYNVSFKIEPNTHPVLAVECSENIESIVRNLYEKNLTLFTYIGEQKKGLMY